MSLKPADLLIPEEENQSAIEILEEIIEFLYLSNYNNRKIEILKNKILQI